MFSRLVELKLTLGLFEYDLREMDILFFNEEFYDQLFDPYFYFEGNIEESSLLKSEESRSYDQMDFNNTTGTSDVVIPYDDIESAEQIGVPLYVQTAAPGSVAENQVTSARSAQPPFNNNKASMPIITITKDIVPEWFDKTRVANRLTVTEHVASIKDEVVLKNRPQAISRTPVRKQSFKCSECSSLFRSRESLYLHQTLHEERNRHQYCCQHKGCARKYLTLEGLRLHNRNYHQVSKPWKCFVQGCRAAFVRKSDLKLHIIRLHIKERPFPCHVKNCTKEFACHSELRRHLSKFHHLRLPKPSRNAFTNPKIPLLESLLEVAKSHHYKRKEQTE